MFSVFVCVCSLYLCTSKDSKPLQAYFDHLERFLGFVQGDGLRALLLNINLQMVLQVAANA